MKKILSIVLILIIFSYTQAQEYHYYYKGKQIPLSLNTGLIYVTSKNVSNKEQLLSIIGSGFEITKSGFDNSPQTVNRIEQESDNLKTISKVFRAEIKILNSISEQEYWAIIKRLKGQDNIEYVSPCFFSETIKNADPGNLVVVELKSANDLNKLKDFCTENKINIVGQNKFMPLWYSLSCTKNSFANSLEISNLLYESGLFANVEPDFFGGIELTCVNDPLFPHQWGLRNTGQNGGTTGIDINACNAWQVTTGFGIIITAIIDEGFEMNHPDLAVNVWGFGYDAQNGSNGSVVYGSHATATAGIVGAFQNDNLGISGVAPTSSIMSVSTDLAGGNTTSQIMADAINWAWQNGASVLSNSWGGGPQSVLIDNAIINALSNGRNGLGSVVVFSTGNNSSAVVSPAKDIADILAVGAVDRCGIRSGRIDSVPLSCDPWCTNCHAGSNFGAELDLVAPCSTISTTDRQGANGYNTAANASGDYTDNFGGTSAACPYVAGVAALILSVNPCLTQEQVAEIIESTTQKIRPDIYTYATTTGRSNGQWNNELGYGLVDAEAAVIAANSNAFLQHRTETTNTSRNCIGNIFAGKNVTQLIQQGNYVISNTANVEIKSSHSITFEPGFSTVLGAVMNAHIATYTGDCHGWLVSFKTDNPKNFEPTNNQIGNIQQDTQGSIIIYPNPFANDIRINFGINEDNTPVSIVITDVLGRLVYEKSIQYNVGSQDLSIVINSSASIFIAKVCVGNQCKVQKLIKYAPN